MSKKKLAKIAAGLCLYGLTVFSGCNNEITGTTTTSVQIDNPSKTGVIVTLTQKKTNDKGQCLDLEGKILGENQPCIYEPAKFNVGFFGASKRERTGENTLEKHVSKIQLGINGLTKEDEKILLENMLGNYEAKVYKQPEIKDKTLGQNTEKKLPLYLIQKNEKFYLQTKNLVDTKNPHKIDLPNGEYLLGWKFPFVKDENGKYHKLDKNRNLVEVKYSKQIEDILKKIKIEKEEINIGKIDIDSACENNRTYSKRNQKCY